LVAALLEHLKAALAIADELRSSTVGYLVETAWGRRNHSR
jgi:hypothetical protein